MTTRRGWRAWLAAVVPMGLAGLATLAFGRGSGSGYFPPREPGGPASSPALASAPPASWPGLPPGRRAAGPGGQAAGMPQGREASLLLPAWRTVLEARWQERLNTVTSLSLAYHDAAERSDRGHRAGDQPEPPQLRRLMREAVAARRALSDTEEALGRLSAGTYGRCEQCATAIPATRLLQDPETRYCELCVRQAAGQQVLGLPGASKTGILARCPPDPAVTGVGDEQVARAVHRHPYGVSSAWVAGVGIAVASGIV